MSISKAMEVNIPVSNMDLLRNRKQLSHTVNNNQVAAPISRQPL
jgi:hypothetical protein